MTPPTPSTSHTIQRDTAPSVGRHAPVPGAPLARPERQIAIGTVLQRFPETSLAVTPRSLRWRWELFLCGLQRLTLIL
jgi:cytochrome P450